MRRNSLPKLLRPLNRHPYAGWRQMFSPGLLIQLCPPGSSSFRSLLISSGKASRRMARNDSRNAAGALGGGAARRMTDHSASIIAASSLEPMPRPTLPPCSIGASSSSLRAAARGQGTGAGAGRQPCRTAAAGCTAAYRRVQSKLPMHRSPRSDCEPAQDRITAANNESTRWSGRLTRAIRGGLV
jgi:hypothetical protein